jgi:hypothetical protein
MKPFYMGVDVSKGYGDFMILDHQKCPVVKAFQLDDTFDGRWTPSAGQPEGLNKL